MHSWHPSPRERSLPSDDASRASRSQEHLFPFQRLREVKGLAQSHTASEWQAREREPGQLCTFCSALDPRSLFLL